MQDGTTAVKIEELQALEATKQELEKELDQVERLIAVARAAVYRNESFRRDTEEEAYG